MKKRTLAQKEEKQLQRGTRRQARKRGKSFGLTPFKGKKPKGNN